MSILRFDKELFDPFFEDWTNKETTLNTKVNIKEKPESFELSLECPGIPKENIKIEHVGNHVKISGELKKEKDEKDEKHHLIERSYGKFERQFQLPKSAKMDEIKAKTDNGVLYLSIPKQKTETPKTKEVKIE